MKLITILCLTMFCLNALAEAADIKKSKNQVVAKPFVGVYYYPWYRHHIEKAFPDLDQGIIDALDREARKYGEKPSSWHDKYLRNHLIPKQSPLLGLYNSVDAKVIGKHIEQSVRGNIQFWATSWWGENGFTDYMLKDHILKHPDAGKLKYAILYETDGRIKGTKNESDNPFTDLNFDNLIPDFKYIRDTYFSNPNYLKVNGKGVVFIYLGRAYFREQAGHDAIAKLRKAVPQAYIVSDDVFGEGYEANWAKPFDAITAYDVYGQSTKEFGGTHRAIDELAKNYKHAKQEAHGVGTAFIPAIAPGYNDRAVRDGNPGRARYFVDDPDSKEGDIFRSMIDDVALKTLDANVNNMMIVTSFNEWFEDSQIEPTVGDQPASRKDDSGSGDYFTGGQNYVDYGHLYLDILAKHTR